MTKGWGNTAIVLVAIAVAALFVVRVRELRHRQDEAEAAERVRRAAPTVAVAPGLSVQVVSSAPPGAQFLCSRCLRPFPASHVHVVPTRDEVSGAYSGSYRCDEDWKPSLAETRARFEKDAPEEEVGAMLEVLVRRGVSKDVLRTYTAGKPGPEAARAVLDAVARGEIVIPLM